VVEEGVRRDPLRELTALPTDTALAAAVAAARRCGARLDPGKVPERELLDLAELYLWRGEDSSAVAIVEGRLASGAGARRPVADRAWALSNAIRILLNVRPARTDVARELASRLDRMGAEAASARVAAHAGLAEHYRALNDTANLRVEANAVIAAGALASEDERAPLVSTLIRSYAHLATIESDRGDRDATLAVYARAATELERTNPGLGRYMNSLAAPYRLLGRRAENLEARWWFNARDSAAPHPRPGKLSLVVFVDADCGYRCEPAYDMYRRLAESYGPQGLEIIYLARTVGFFKDKGPLEPSEEAQISRAFFLDTLRLPGALAVSETKFTHKPDGRRTNLPDPNVRRYGGRGWSMPAYTVLVDREGVIRLVVERLDPMPEEVLRVAIEEIVASR
jgi:hypothetical protein